MTIKTAQADTFGPLQMPLYIYLDCAHAALCVMHRGTADVRVCMASS